ncbi:hypothetical protein [Kitasatospora sp. NPDC002965]|uniref:hypothetical protein n=1 Tax=Kitasatospora sp. NPDC002965 TaxID=3154775 RepID=UPI0033A71F8E
MYESLDALAAAAVIRSWAADGAATPVGLDTRLTTDVCTPIRNATSRYLLGELSEDACLDYGPVHVEFHEPVLIERRMGVLTLLVAAAD